MALSTPTPREARDAVSGVPALPGDQRDQLALLRQRISRLERPGLSAAEAGVELVTHPALAPVLRLRAGGAYQVDSTTLALMLLAGPSRAGAWGAVLGVDDLGAEAAAAWGVELSRTIVVPEPGEQWLEALGAVIDVAGLVVVRPPRPSRQQGRRGAGLAPSVTERLAARLRERSAALVVLGEWPRATARLRLADVAWSGVGHGEGLLARRRAVVEVQRGAAPPARVVLDGEAAALVGGSVAPVRAPGAPLLRQAAG